MKITIEKTATVTKIDGVPVRLWTGVTERGIKCEVFVHRIAVCDLDDCTQFEEELAQQAPPVEALSLRQVI